MELKDKINLIYEYYKSLSSENLDEKGQYFTGEASNENNISDRLYEYTVGLFDYNGFPEVIEDRFFDGIHAKTYYHGFKSYDFGANYLVHYNYHMGIGVTGNGFYLTENYNQALNYTSEHSKAGKDQGRVLKTKLTGNKILYTHLDYIAEVLSGKEKLDPEMLTESEYRKVVDILNVLEDNKNAGEALSVKMFLFVIYNNPTILGIILGADYIDLYNREGDNPFAIVLNRSAMIVKASDRDRFVENSTMYNSGAFDSGKT